MVRATYIFSNGLASIYIVIQDYDFRQVTACKSSRSILVNFKLFESERGCLVRVSTLQLQKALYRLRDTALITSWRMPPISSALHNSIDNLKNKIKNSKIVINEII